MERTVVNRILHIKFKVEARYLGLRQDQLAAVEAIARRFSVDICGYDGLSVVENLVSRVSL